jgi:hypothetical protein
VGGFDGHRMPEQVGVQNQVVLGQSGTDSPDRLDHWLYIATLQDGLHPLL